jgi:methyl-accepting chemotaxis protein
MGAKCTVTVISVISVLTASTDLTATAETLSREVEKFPRNLRADPVENLRCTST